MNINSIPVENARARRYLPANLQVRGSEGVNREEGRGSGSKKEVPFIPFDRDDVAISSGSRTRTQIQQDLLQFHVSFTRNRIGIEEEGPGAAGTVPSGIAAYPAEGVTEGKVVQGQGSVGPYSLNVNQSAMKRYEQAASYRIWHPTTFEITI